MSQRYPYDHNRWNSRSTFNGMRSPRREYETYRIPGASAYPGGPFVPIPFEVPRFNIPPPSQRSTQPEFIIPPEMKQRSREWLNRRRNL